MIDFPRLLEMERKWSVEICYHLIKYSIIDCESQPIRKPT